MSAAHCIKTQHLPVRYDPQITHGKQIGNRKQTFLEKQGTLSETNYQLNILKINLTKCSDAKIILMLISLSYILILRSLPHNLVKLTD